MEIMKKHKSPKKWDLIAEKLSRDKSPRECEERWLRFLKPGSRKGQWTEEEDLVVLEAVRNSTEEIFTRWSDLAQQLPGRVGKQVRDRWVNHLNPAINHLPFSREDVSRFRLPFVFVVDFRHPTCSLTLCMCRRHTCEGSPALGRPPPAR